MEFQKTRITARPAWARLIVPFIAMSLLIAACGSDSEGKEAPPDVGISVTSGSFTTTVRSEGVTEVPFSETVTVDVVFDESIYGTAGQTSVYAEADPTDYRVGSRPPRNERSFTFSLTNRTPGTVEVSVFASRDGEPAIFTLAIGDVAEE